MTADPTRLRPACGVERLRGPATALLCTVVGALALAGCAAADKGAYEASPAAPGEQRAVSAFAAELQQLESRLDASLATALEPDCVAARPLSERICELAAHICAIAERHPTDRPLSQRCAQGRQSCQRGRKRVDTSCSRP